MKTKLLEIRDRATFIPAIAIEISWEDGFLASRAGYGSRCILFGRLDGGEFRYDPYQWGGGSRTMPQAHLFIVENWDSIRSKDVIDVEFILNETTAKKTSETTEVETEL